MTRKQKKNRARMLYEKDILTPLRRRRKVIEDMKKALTKEKIEEVKALIESGAKKADIIERAGVSASTVDRVKSGQLTAEGRADKPAKPKADKPEPQAYAEPETPQGLITPRELDALRALIGQAVKAFAGIEGETTADSYNLGQTFGLLTAAQMILEEGRDGE